MTRRSELLVAVAAVVAAVAVLAAPGVAGDAPPPGQRSHPFASDEVVAEAHAKAVRDTARLTLEQKARQLDMWHGYEFLTNGRLNESKARAILDQGVGLIHDLYPANGAALTNTLQRWALEGEVGLPALLLEECLHGVEQRDHSIFPNPQALGATFSPETVHAVAGAIRAEARSYGVRMCLAPVLGVARDPRWGRTEELLGEDPYAVSQHALAYVTALQTAELGNETVVAEPKHFAAHSVPQGGRNKGPSHVGRRELEMVFLPPFRAAVQEAGALSVMAAYSELDGVPCPANPFLLTETLRERFGFQGFVLSDLGAVQELQGTHRVVATAAEAVIEYLVSGGNAQFYDYPHQVFSDSIVAGVRNGSLPEAVLDARVADVLRVKNLLRLKEQPYTDPSLSARVVASPAHQRVALDAARQAVVLLANRNGTLPLNQSAVPALALLGSSAFQARWGDYSGGGGNVNNLLSVTLEQALLDRGVPLFREWGTGVSDPYELNPVHRTSLRTPPGFGGQQQAQGLKGEYWTNTGLSGTPALVRHDQEVNFQWYHYDFAGSYAREAVFSARWTGTLVPPSTVPDAVFALDFSPQATSGARLWLNGTLVVDAWNCTADACPAVGTHPVREGVPLDLRVEYRQSEGDASVALEWGLAGRDGILRAVAAAERARDAGGVAVVCVGDSQQSSGENHDRALLGLPGQQERLVEAVVATNVTTVVVMLSGRAAAVPWAAAHADALLEGFGLGQAQGTALAEVLFGDVNPAGRLPVTFPKAVGQVDLFYDHMASSRKDYQYIDAHPLYAFGHGLSYTEFRYLWMSVSRPVVAESPSSFTVTVALENAGTRDGDEVVQLYVRDDVSSVTTPVRQLRGFRRVPVAAGQRAEVTFTLRVPDDLWLWNRQGEWAAENGTFTLWAGGSSDRTPLNATVLLAVPASTGGSPGGARTGPASDAWVAAGVLLAVTAAALAVACHRPGARSGGHRRVE